MSVAVGLLGVLLCGADDIRVVVDDGSVVGRVNGTDVLVYHIDPVQPTGENGGQYRRSGFIHPLRTLSGVVVTDDFSPDHPHQNGLFSTWVDVKIDGRRVDFWNRRKVNGTFRHAKLASTDENDGVASFSVLIEHVDETNPAGPAVALVENRTYRLSTRGDFVVIDIHAIQRCETTTPVTMNEYHYGGAAMRGARQWTMANGAGFLTSEGLSREDGNHVRSRWMQLYGPTPDGEAEASITAISYPLNFRYPEPVRLHPEMPYSVFSPCVLGEFTIEPGRPLEMRYRYVIADGRPDTATINKLTDEFAETR